MDAVLIGGGLADRLRGEGLADPASEAARAEQILEDHFPATQSNFVVLVETEREINDRGIARQGVALVQRLAAEESVISVNSYWTSGVVDLRSENGHYALVLVQIDGDPADAREAFDRIAPHYQGRHGDLLLRVGGELAVQAEMERTIAEDLVRAEMIALPIVFVLLVIVFGSAVAALLPLLVGIVSIIGTNAALAVITELHRRVGVRAEPHHRARARARHRLRAAARAPLPRRAGEGPADRRGDRRRPCAPPGARCSSRR